MAIKKFGPEQNPSILHGGALAVSVPLVHSSVYGPEPLDHGDGDDNGDGDDDEIAREFTAALDTFDVIASDEVAAQNTTRKPSPGNSGTSPGGV